MNEDAEKQANARIKPSEPGARQFQEPGAANLPANFDVIRSLGNGSMACVYLVRNNALKRLAAVKVLHEVLAADPICRKRFVREAQAAARISHPCVTSVYAVGALSNDVPYIEMEYVEGNNLAEMLRSHGRLDVAAARKFLAQLAGALAAAHDKRIIHRDVKPANVLVEHDSQRAFLTDFGLAGILETGSEAVTRLTREGECIGDPTYMSPEQLRGDALTPQADIYGLGILGYKLLTLHGPFAHLEVTNVTGAHLRRPPLDLHTAYPDIPIDLSDALKRCLSKKPEHRPRAKDLVELFESAGPASTNSDRVVSADAAPKSALLSFLHEAKKRRVYRAAMTYAAITFVVLQVADLVLPPFEAPEWMFRLLVVASVAGFPLAVVLAWLFDLQQGRLLRTSETAGSFFSRTSRTQRLVLQALGLALSVALAAVAAWWFLAPGD